MNTTTMIRTGLWAMAALIAGVMAAVFFIASTGSGSPTAGEGPYGSSFQLVDQNGAPVTEADLRGTPAAVFFGFTHCPDVCPTTLYELSGYQKQIAAEGGELKVVFVTVDPERDTPPVMKDYVAAVSPDITALTGSPENVAAMLKGWGVYSRKVGEGADYTMDHTATTFLLDADGALAGTLAYGEDPETAKAKLERLTGV
ncbi:SCO family protein [Aurantimonas sp. HBX-1]|uniref:SCO family protein n=1 Tax=Aurantimonas sp. HBX-1 TaxID=2906072 RepID=UPI001F3459CC|nr:SCO family protein [Aurantimonas sp. HBX-1]UIJ70538.1 SCO family protein [Aurantimonas sp. HBX-1]